MTKHIETGRKTNRALRRELLAAASLAALIGSPAILGAPAQAQTVPPAAEGGAIPLPTVEVEANRQGGAGGEGGGGPPESPGEKAGYSAPPVKQSTTKIDVPTFDLPIAVNTVPEQVIQDQNAITLQDALQNISGVQSNGRYNVHSTWTIRGFNTNDAMASGLAAKRPAKTTILPICRASTSSKGQPHFSLAGRIRRGLSIS